MAYRYVRDQGLTVKRKTTQLEYFEMRLTQARVGGGKESIIQYGNIVDRVRENNARKNLRKQANKRENKRFVREYVSNLAENMSAVDQNEEHDDVEPLAVHARL